MRCGSSGCNSKYQSQSVYLGSFPLVVSTFRLPAFGNSDITLYNLTKTLENLGVRANDLRYHKKNNTLSLVCLPQDCVFATSLPKKRLSRCLQNPSNYN